MASISAKDIMALRAKTSAGIGLCKEALEATNGDMEKAIEYVNARSDIVSRLRNQTGVKVGLAKIALKDADNDYEKAVAIIKERGWEGADVDGDVKVEGGIGVYVHTDRKTVALVHVYCVTDFVAKNEKFVEFCNELAKQAAAMKPRYASREDIPAEKLDELNELFKREALEEGKPENILDKIVEGKLNKYFAENCLLEQKWFKDESKTMQQFVDENVQSIGEPLTVKKVIVSELGK